VALDREALRRGLRICTWEGVTAQLHLSVVTSAVLTGLALRLGAGELTLGLLGALPIACRPLQLLSAALLDRGVDHKPIFTWGALIHRAVWIVPALLLLWPLGDDTRLSLLVAAVAVSYAAAAPTENAWVSWAADYVPAGIRGRYFGLRNLILYAVGQTAALGAAYCVDRLGPADEGLSHLLVFGAAVLSGLVSVWLLARYPKPRRRHAQGFRLLPGLRRALANPNLRRLLVAAGLWNVAVGIGGPFFAPHALDYIGFDYTTFQFYGVLWTVAALLTNRFWGRALDDFGSRPLLVIAGAALGVFPLIWALTGPGLSWPLWPEALGSGACWAAFNLALFAAPLGIARRETRPYAIAAVAVTTGLGYLVGSTLGGLLAEGIGGTRPLLGGWLTGYQSTFIVSGLARLGAAVFFARLDDPGGDHLRPLAAHLGEVGLKRPLYWLRGLFRRTE
jgi:MFS family permease